MTTPRSGTLLTRGPLLRAVLAFGWPLVAGMAFHSLFNLVDIYIVGKLPASEVAIAAASIPSLVNSIPMVIYNGIVTAAIALIARHAGLGNHRRGNYEAGQGILLSVLLGIVFGVPPYLAAEPICAALGAEGGRPVQLVDQPFLGLRAFDEEHAHLFFGRETETEELVEKLRREPLLMVVGDSGSGKSSLVRAGLVPRFRGGALADLSGDRPDDWAGLPQSESATRRQALVRREPVRGHVDPTPHEVVLA